MHASVGGWFSGGAPGITTALCPAVRNRPSERHLECGQVLLTPHCPGPANYAATLIPAHNGDPEKAGVVVGHVGEASGGGVPCGSKERGQRVLWPRDSHGHHPVYLIRWLTITVWVSHFWDGTCPTLFPCWQKPCLVVCRCPFSFCFYAGAMPTSLCG